MKTLGIIIFILFFSTIAYAETTTPNTFVSGTTVIAEAMNENFTVLVNGINKNTQEINNMDKPVITIYSETNVEGVGSVSCKENERILGGGCYCSGGGATTTNYANLFACIPDGNSWLGGCYDDKVLYQTSKDKSPIVIFAICQSGSTDFNDSEKTAIALEKLKEMKQARDLQNP